MKNVTLRQLRIFEAAARHLSFSRAAEELFLTQPAVSMQIKQLEESTGIRLFEHIGKRVYLTQAGSELLVHARAIAHQMREAEAALAALSGSFAGLLDIALISTAKYFVPGLLAQFCKRFPQAEIKISVNNREQVLAKLHANECDLAIMGQPPDALDCIAEVFAPNPLAIVSAPAHPMSRRHRLALADLENEVFLIRESGSGTRGAMERLFAERQIAPQRFLEMGSNETIKQAVMAGLGIALISLQTARHELAAGRLTILPVDGLPLQRQWHVVHLRQKNLSPLTDEFRQFLIVEGAALIETM
jgi:DNA-binding transcriptional LysR family regulator